MPRRPVGLAVLLLSIAFARPAAAQPDAGQESAGQPASTKARLAPAGADGRRNYIIQLAEAPLASFRGGLGGLKATSPRATGAKRLDVAAPSSRSYLAYLNGRQAHAITAMARAVGHPVTVVTRYRYAYNGLAVRLNAAEAAEVAALPGVVHLEPAVIDPLHTDVGPGLINAPSIWDGSATGGLPGTKGEGVVAGVIDTGINTGHPSFAAVGGDGYTHTNPRGKYLGWCDPANPNYKPEYQCNDKLIGLWSFPGASMNPEDEHGHGSHTSGTVAGNILPVKAPTITMDRSYSGVAPHANVIMYEACIGTGCDSTATTAAIDQATADGVDVINYSIGLGQDSPWHNSRLVAFHGAYEAGIFVAASAGNAGNPATVNAHAPWITSVAATTHGRSYNNALVNLTGGQGTQADLRGAGMTAAFGPAPIVYAKGFKKADGSEDDGLCNEAFPAATFSGQIVVCDRGGVGRVVKGGNVLAGGAGGLVLANAASNGEGAPADPHVLPAVNLGFSNGQALKDWLGQGSDHMASIAGVQAQINPAQVDLMAAFSSRGPARTGICCRRPDMDIDRTWFDLLKPDIGAPGVNIMAAVAHDPAATTPELGFLSGTSMASPHLAGAGALVVALHPDWTPAEVQSALMLTARTDVLKNTAGNATYAPFDSGSGRVDLQRAAQTALVMDVPVEDFDTADPDLGGEPSTLNLASMADAWCFGPCGWQRTVRSTRSAGVHWTASVAPAPHQESLPAGFTVAVSPTEFELAPGATQALEVTADASSVAVGQWVFAQVVLTPSESTIPTAHLMVAVRRVDRRLPPAVVVNSTMRLGEFVKGGFQLPAATALRAMPYGLLKGDMKTDSVAPDPTNGDPFDNPGVNLVFTRTVPADAIRLVAETTASTAKDVDLYVGRDTNGDGVPQESELVCTSGGSSWEELCDVTTLQPGTYWIMALNFAGSGAPRDDISLASGVVLRADEGNLRVAVPTSVAAAAPFEVTVSWSLPAIARGDRWYGAFELLDGSTSLGMVVVDVVGESDEPPSRFTIYLPKLEKPDESVPPGPTSPSSAADE